MNAKEAEKKQRELEEGREAAAYLNQELGADYEAIPSDREPADVLFVSTSKQLPERMVQVVTIPHDSQIRADNQNLGRFARDLKTALKTRYASNVSPSASHRSDRLRSAAFREHWLKSLPTTSWGSSPNRRRRRA